MAPSGTPAQRCARWGCCSSGKRCLQHCLLGICPCPGSDSPASRYTLAAMWGAFFASLWRRQPHPALKITASSIWRVVTQAGTGPSLIWAAALFPLIRDCHQQLVSTASSSPSWRCYSVRTRNGCSSRHHVCRGLCLSKMSLLNLCLSICFRNLTHQPP